MRLRNVLTCNILILGFICCARKGGNLGKAISITSRDRYDNVKNDYINKIADPRARESAALAFDMSMGS